GTMLYELLTGKLPFKKNSHLATLKAIESDDPKPLRKIRAEVPIDLEAICLKALEKLPDRRYASAHELSADLNRWLNGLPVEARSASSIEKLTAWTKRNPVVAGSLVTTFLALLIGFSVAMVQRNEAIRSREAAKKANARADQQEQRTDQQLDTMQAVINELAQLEKQLIHSKEHGQLRANLTRRIGDMQKSLMQNETMTPEMRYRSAKALCPLPAVLLRMRENELAAENVENILKLLDGIETEAPRFAKSAFVTRVGLRMNLADALGDLGKFDEALEQLTANFEAPVPDELPPVQRVVFRAENTRSQASVYMAKGDLTAAADACKRGLQVLEEIDSPTDFRSKWDYELTRARLQATCGRNLFEVSRVDEATDFLNQAAAGIPKLRALIPDSPHLDQLEGNIDATLGRLFSRQGKSAEAIERFQKCRKSFFNLARSWSDNVVFSEEAIAISNNLVNEMMKEKRYEEVIELAGRDLKFVEGFSDAALKSQRVIEKKQNIEQALQFAKAKLKAP
ncbi:MAG: hypothetical protein AAF497_18055, partial [Planctomycetota bacterium]